VAAQIGVSVVLLSAAGLLLKSFRNLEQQNLGMQTRNIITVQVPLNADRYPTNQACMNFYLRAEKSLQSLPSVAAVAMSNSVPPDGNGWHDDMRYADLMIVGHPPAAPGTGGSVVVRAVTPAYFRVLGIAILQGRGFSEADRQSGGDLIILSKLLADRLFPQGDAVGQHLQRGVYEPYLKTDGPALTIVGVAANVKNEGLANQNDPEYYTLWTERRPEAWSRHHIFLLQTAFPPSMIGPLVKSRIAQLDPTLPVDIDTLDHSVTALADRPRFESALLSFFALCGLLMAVIGLYGVISYVATQRTQEIGVRMALGATRADILGLIALEGIRLILVGSAIGLVAALSMAQLLRHLMFHVGPRDAATYAAVMLLLAAVAITATLIPAMAAMRTDPGKALRCE
jgi:predicted permease